MAVVVPAVDPASVAVVSCVLPTLSTLALAARIYDRKFRRRLRLEKDDWALCVSLICLWALAIVNLVGVGIKTLGLHSEKPQPGDPSYLTIHRTKADDDIEVIVQVYSIIEKFAFFAYKASVCFAYRRIFPYESFRRVCLGVLVFLALQCIAFLIATGLQCRLKNWGVWYQDWAAQEHCAQSELVWIAYQVSEVAIDLFLLFSPMSYLFRMNLRTSKKISTMIMFSLGGISVAVGIARMSYLLAFTYTGDRGYRDLMGLQSTMLVWSLAECSIAIIASNISAIRNLVFRDKQGRPKSYWRKLTGSGQDRKNSYDYLGSQLSDESRPSDRRRLMRDRSVSVGFGGRDRSTSIGYGGRDARRGRSRSNTRDLSVGPPIVAPLPDLELGPTQYGRQDSWL